MDATTSNRDRCTCYLPQRDRSDWWPCMATDHRRPPSPYALLSAELLRDRLHRMVTMQRTLAKQAHTTPPPSRHRDALAARPSLLASAATMRQQVANPGPFV